MSKTSLQYQVLKQGGPLTKVSVPYPTPGPSEICIRPKAIALNPLDWKRRDYGVMVESWPVVLGIDAAGIVDSVGESVKDVKAGDEGWFSGSYYCPLVFRGQKACFLDLRGSSVAPVSASICEGDLRYGH
jgi:NADPH:quinone reductase-like Zn-dependent oxidoreductase